MRQQGNNKSGNGWTENERFVNPYNFVSFKKVQRSKHHQVTDGKTGYIKCELTTLTPLFIPNTSNDKALHDKRNNSEASSYDFFSYTDLSERGYEDIVKNPSAPVIPGSEIRGMVRSVYEAAFRGCMINVDLERTLGRRSPEAKKAGILKKTNDVWSITPCERVMLNTSPINNLKFGVYIKPLQYNTWKEGQMLYVKKAAESYKKTGCFVITAVEEKPSDPSGWIVGYLHKGEPFGKKKHHESVFIPPEDEKPVALSRELAEAMKRAMQGERQPANTKEAVEDLMISAEVVEGLKTAIKEYQDAGKNKNSKDKKWYKQYEVREKQTLVYYQLNDNNEACYLSPACIGKEIFQQSVKGLLENSGVEPCKNRNEVCPACALFGMVAKEPNAKDALSSRLRFGDGELLELQADKLQDCYCAPMTLPEMGEPKPGAVEFYTLAPSEKKGDSYGYWTYDYEIKDGKRKFFDMQKPPKKLQLRGRKFYWHSDPDEKILKNANEPNKMSQRIRPLKPTEPDNAVRFTFNIYFDGVTEPELKQLCWALTFNDKSCAHKLGRAKPLGFGSVKIAIAEIRERTIDRTEGSWVVSQLFDGKDENAKKLESTCEVTVVMQEIKTMMDWENRFSPKATEVRQAEVCYPKGNCGSGDNAMASHQWFTGNRSRSEGASGVNPKFAKVLPKVIEEVTQQDSDSAKSKWLYALKKS